MGKKKHQIAKKHHQEKGHHTGFRWKKAYSILAISVAVITVLGLVVFVAARNTGEESQGTFVPSLGNQHIRDANATGIQYNSDPPTSGPHYGEGLAPWGIHTEPVPKGSMIHNLEDGGVVVSYSPQAPKETVDRLAQIVKRYPQNVVLAPYPGLDTTIALTAWQRIDKMDVVDEARIARFIESYKGIDHHVK